MFGLTPFSSRRNEGLTRISDELDLRSVFDKFFNESIFPAAFTSGHPMKADIRETEKEYIIDAELPGLKKEDIKLDLLDNTFTILAEQNEQINEEKENYIRKERRYGSFSRSFYVENVRHEDVTAKYNNGVLTVTLPKTVESKENKRRIEIQ